MTRATTTDDSSTGTTDWESKRMELAAARGHDEARDRLLQLGRSEHVVRSLELMNSPLEFARLVVETERFERERAD